MNIKQEIMRHVPLIPYGDLVNYLPGWGDYEQQEKVWREYHRRRLALRELLRNAEKREGFLDSLVYFSDRHLTIYGDKIYLHCGGRMGIAKAMWSMDVLSLSCILSSRRLYTPKGGRKMRVVVG